MKPKSLLSLFMIALLLSLAGCKRSSPSHRVDVKVVYPGTSAEDISQLVIRPLESELMGIPGLFRMYSQTSRDEGLIILEFEAKTDLFGDLDAVRKAVDAASQDLPSDLLAPPMIRTVPRQHVGFSVKPDPFGRRSLNIASLASLGELLETREHITRTEVRGVAEAQFRIEYDWYKLWAYGLSPADLREQLKDKIRNGPVLATGLGGQEFYLEDILYQTVSTEAGDIPINQLVSVAFEEETTEDPELLIWVEDEFKEDLAAPIEELVEKTLQLEGDYLFSKGVKRNLADYVLVEIHGGDPYLVTETTKELTSTLRVDFPVKEMWHYPEQEEFEEIMLSEGGKRVEGVPIPVLEQAFSDAYQTSELGMIQERGESYPVYLRASDPLPPPRQVVKAIPGFPSGALQNYPAVISWKTRKEAKVLRKDGNAYAVLILKPERLSNPSRLRKSVRKYLKNEAELPEGIKVEARLLDFNVFDYFGENR